MSNFSVMNGVVIDDVDYVVENVRRLSGRKISGIETIQKFVNGQKNTYFYVDKKGTCRMCDDGDSTYLWIDSGYTDYYGNPIFVSLLKSYGEYVGHYAGTMSMLSRNIKSYFPRYASDISRNMGMFLNKYNKKAEERKVKHIVNEDEFFVSEANDVNGISINLGTLISDFKFDLVDEPIEDTVEQIEEEKEIRPTFDMNYREKEITVGLLLETIDGMQNYINEMLEEMSKFKQEDKARIEELEAKNEEYKRVIKGMREFNEAENRETGETTFDSYFGGHDLLGRNGKILVFGASALDMNTMNGIAKLFGFEKKDFEYETDYTKLKSYFGRVGNADRYEAIILGACPHKVAGLGDWSNVITKCQNCNEMPIAVDARSHSGELKVTKESYKKALLDICNQLREKAA